jgi:hypothetical protein
LDPGLLRGRQLSYQARLRPRAPLKFRRLILISYPTSMGSSRSAVMPTSFIYTMRLGPATSFMGSPTVSPTRSSGVPKGRKRPLRQGRLGAGMLRLIIPPPRKAVRSAESPRVLASSAKSAK